MLKRYPAIRPYKTHQLPVQEPHVLYIEESGSKDGIPVIVAHGGPGAGSHPDQRRFFDPMVYRIILFDQRGCGQSTPLGLLENNDTQALIADMEALRKHLNIEKWVVFGGSWGATLSLLYAQAYPQNVLGLILRSVLLGNKVDRNWFFKEGGASRFYPQDWDDFSGIIPPSERGDLVRAYRDRLHDKSDLVQIKAAKAWSLWHRRCATFNPIPEANHNGLGTMRLARLECHYFLNHCFIDENQILNNMDKIKNIPGIIVHGRHDMITPVSNSAQLQKAWKRSDLDIVHDAGHASSDPTLTEALVKATEYLSKIIGNKSGPRGA